MTDFSKMEITGLPVPHFEANRAKFFDTALKRIEALKKGGILVIKAGDEIPRYDADVPHFYFFQEANFYYLTGVLEPSLNAAIDFSSKTVTLFYDQPSNDTKVWQTVISKEEMQKKYKLDVVDKRDMYKWLSDKNPESIYPLEGINDVSSLPVQSIEFDFPEEYSHLKDRVKSEWRIYEVLKECRKNKTPQEIELMKFISKETVEAHKLMMKAMKPGIYERDLENVFNNYFMEKLYCRIWGYGCIAASGVNASTLHYDINDKKINDGDLFLADMGARFCNYVSDVTTTFPTNGKFTKKQKEIYDIVLSTNLECQKLVKPGANFLDIHYYSCRLIVRGLRALGLLSDKYSEDDLYYNNIQYYFYPHRLGHYVGIEVHDVHEVEYLDHEVLVANQVITIEPGIYFRPYLLEQAFNDPNKAKYLNIDKIKEYYDFGGVRIEDDLLVTEDGSINMNAGMPRTTQEIEEFMKK